jgi:hypothetical protein
VIASSSSQELSQESDALSGSYFTHHFVTGLRGAGDADGDGRVSLDEAYRYAYRRTLAATAATRVGEQHVTLENDLAGHDELPVTWPAQARAKLELPAELDARVLVQRRPGGAVLAEVDKVRGAPVRLALVAGSYDATIAASSSAVQCRLELKDDVMTALPAAGSTECTPVRIDAVQPKGPAVEAQVPRTEGSRWQLELNLGAMSGRDDAYSAAISQFNYRDNGPTASFRLGGGVSRDLLPHVSLLLEVTTLANASYQRDVGAGTDTARLSAYQAALGLRLHTTFLTDWLGAFIQADAGAALGLMSLDTQQTGVPPTTTETYFGPTVGVAGGLSAALGRWAIVLQVSYDYAPVIKNLIGDTHDSGGLAVVVGARFRLGAFP